MENYNNSSDNGQDKTEQQSVWTITTIVLLTEKIKLNVVSMENYNNISFDTAQDKTK